MGRGLQPSRLQRSPGPEAALSFFSFQQTIFTFLFDFQIFFNLCIFQMHAISTPLLQIEHMGYVFGVESCKLQDGADHLLVWASIIAELWHFCT